MTDTDAKQLVLNIIEQAQNNETLKFQQIKFWHDFRYYTKLARSTKLIIKTLKTSAKRLFKEYCKDVEVGTSDVNKLLAYSQLQDIIAFYNTNLNVINRMLDDYDDYLGHGHFWYSFFGGERDWNTL